MRVSEIDTAPSFLVQPSHPRALSTCTRATDPAPLPQRMLSQKDRWVGEAINRVRVTHFAPIRRCAVSLSDLSYQMDRFKDLSKGIPRRLRQQLEFILEIDALKGVLRRSYLIGDHRHENSAEHSWHLSVAAMVLAEHAKERIDVSKVIRLVLVHDLVEIDAGDTFIYDDAGNVGKAAREQKAANRLFGILPEEQGQTFMALWREFEDRQTPEAKFAFALDRLMPILHNVFTEGGSWKEHRIRQEQALTKNRPIEDGSSILWQAVESLITQTLAK